MAKWDSISSAWPLFESTFSDVLNQSGFSKTVFCAGSLNQSGLSRTVSCAGSLNQSWFWQTVASAGSLNGGCPHPVHLYRCSRRSWHNACPCLSRHEKGPSRKCPGIRCSGRRFCRSCWGRFYCRCRGRQRCSWWGHWGSCLLPCDWTSPWAHNHVDNRTTIVGRNHSEIFI